MSVKLLSRLSRAQLSKACCRSLYSSSAVLPSRLQPLTAPEESDRQCSGFYRAQQSRAFAASGLSDPGPSLDEAIQQELEYEQSTDGSGEVSLYLASTEHIPLQVRTGDILSLSAGACLHNCVCKLKAARTCAFCFQGTNLVSSSTSIVLIIFGQRGAPFPISFEICLNSCLL